MFRYLTKLESVTINCPDIQSIESGAFQDAGSNATKLVELDFTGCKKLEVIKNGAFYNCFKSNSYTVNFQDCSSLERIEDYAFKETDKNKLKSVSLSGCKMLSTIGENAFNYSSNIENLDLSGTAISVFYPAWFEANGIKVINLSNCKGLERKEVDLTKLNNRVNGKTPVDVYLPADLSSVRLPDNLNKIGTIFFQGTRVEAQALGLPLDKVKFIQTITITANSSEKVYDGQQLTDSGYTYYVGDEGSDSKLPDGYSLSATVTGSQIDVGVGFNEITSTKVINASGEDVSEDYVFLCNSGKLEVTPKPITVSAQNMSKTYGDPDPRPTITGMVEGEDESLIEYSVERDEGEDVNDGQPYSVTVTGEAVQGNYSVSYEAGSLTIVPAPVTLTAVSGYAVYNGEEQTLEGFTASVEGLEFDESVNARAAGTEKNTYTVSFENVTLNETKDITGNYVVTETITGTFVITKLVKKSIDGVDGNRVSYRVEVNPDALKLNGGEDLRLLDTLYDAKKNPGFTNQSIDYSTISFDPDNIDDINYDYSGYTGTYTIPDETHVIITYETRVLGGAGEICSFGNAASLLTSDGSSIDEDSTTKTQKIYPKASDVGDQGDYMIKLFVYGDTNMRTGLPDARFFLQDANQRPVYKSNGEKEQYVTSIWSDSYCFLFSSTSLKTDTPPQ